MSGNDQARLAIIGCGAYAQDLVAPALRRIGWRPAVAVDPAPGSADALLRRTGRTDGAASVPDWTVAADAFDAAVLAVPSASHGPVGAALAAAGKHVFVPAPLATTVAAAETLLAAAERAGTVLAAGSPRRHLRVARWTEALIRSGTLGTIRRFEAREGAAGGLAARTEALLWPEEGGVLLTPGAEVLDLLSWWFGEAASVAYRDDARGGGVESDCVLDLGFADGAEGRVELSRSRRLPGTCRIEGSRGSVDVGLARNEVARCSPGVRQFRSGDLAVDTLGEQQPAELLALSLGEFRASLAGRAPAGAAARDGLRAVALAERCYAVRAPLDPPWEAALLPGAGIDVAPGARVVVTGATGFVGSRLVERLVAAGAVVRCLVRGYASAARLARLPVEIRRVDLADAAAVEDATRDAALVFHLAYDWGSAAQNLAGTRNLVAAARLHGIERLVYVSTFSVYDPVPDGELDEGAPDGDRSGEYTRVKLDGEQEVLRAAREKGLRGTVLQPTIVYGPFSRPWTIDPAEMLLHGTVVLPDNGEGLCNALYVEDLVDALMLAAREERAIGERFLVSGPAPVTWGRFYEGMAAALGAKGPQFWSPGEISKRNSGLRRKATVLASDPARLVRVAARLPVARKVVGLSARVLPESLTGPVASLFAPPRTSRAGLHVPSPGQVRFFSARPVVDSGKARRLLGYRPRYDFEAGMRPTAAYLRWAYQAA